MAVETIDQLTLLKKIVNNYQPDKPSSDSNDSTNSLFTEIIGGDPDLDNFFEEVGRIVDGFNINTETIQNSDTGDIYDDPKVQTLLQFVGTIVSEDTVNKNEKEEIKQEEIVELFSDKTDIRDSLVRRLHKIKTASLAYSDNTRNTLKKFGDIYKERGVSQRWHDINESIISKAKSLDQIERYQKVLAASAAIAIAVSSFELAPSHSKSNSSLQPGAKTVLLSHSNMLNTSNQVEVPSNVSPLNALQKVLTAKHDKNPLLDAYLSTAWQKGISNPAQASAHGVVMTSVIANTTKSLPTPAANSVIKIAGPETASPGNGILSAMEKAKVNPTVDNVMITMAENHMSKLQATHGQTIIVAELTSPESTSNYSQYTTHLEPAIKPTLSPPINSLSSVITPPVFINPNTCPLIPLVHNNFFGNNALIAYNYIISLGYTPVQAAGFIGNFDLEGTGVNPASVQYGYGNTFQYPTNGGGVGIEQATSPAGVVNKLVAWAQSNQLNPTELSTQLAYLKYQLSPNGPEAAAAADIQRTSSITAAAETVMVMFERPSGTHGPGVPITGISSQNSDCFRIQTAIAAYQQFSHLSDPQGSSGASTVINTTASSTTSQPILKDSSTTSSVPIQSGQLNKASTATTNPSETSSSSSSSMNNATIQLENAFPGNVSTAPSSVSTPTSTTESNSQLSTPNADPSISNNSNQITSTETNSLSSSNLSANNESNPNNSNTSTTVQSSNNGMANLITPSSITPSSTLSNGSTSSSQQSDSNSGNTTQPTNSPKS